MNEGFRGTHAPSLLNDFGYAEMRPAREGAGRAGFTLKHDPSGDMFCRSNANMAYLGLNLAVTSMPDPDWVPACQALASIYSRTTGFAISATRCNARW